MVAPMSSVLSDLRHTAGITGCGVITHDGMMVASAFAGSIADDVVAGLTSFLTSTTQRVLREGGMPAFGRFVLHSTHGKLVIVDLGEAYLVVLIDQFSKVDGCMPDIIESSHQLRRQARMV